MNAIDKQRDQIRTRIDLMLREHGTGIAARGDLILALMAEHGISDQSACLHLASGRKRLMQEARRRIEVEA